MGFRFRKSIKIFSGIRLNLSKSGVSTSVGVPGATVNIGQHAARETLGMPGSGISYRSTVATDQQHARRDGWALWLIALLFSAVCAAAILTS